MSTSYWANLLEHSLNRRKAIGLTGATSAGAALFAACGSGKSASTKAEVSKLTARVTDETKNVKRGGTLASRSSLEHPTLDPMAGGGHVGLLGMTYSNLFRISDGYKDNTNGEIVGDLVESWEFAPDQLQLTLKLNAGAAFAPVAPVNGRTVDAGDIAFSWKRFAAECRGRLELANSADPSAPVLSLAATDDRTLAIRLKEPHSVILSLLGQNIAGSYWIMPRESEGGFDIRRQMIGSGPFYLKRYEPSVSYQLARNPNFKQDKRGLPYLDEVSMPIVLETATAVSQFRAGQIWTNVVPSSDILAVKNGVPDVNLFDTGVVHAGIRQFFGHITDSPFRDERIRQAWMFTQDRTSFLDASYDLASYSKQGIPIETTWDHAL